MDLKSPHPFWLVKNGLPYTYPPLEGDAQAEIVVLGAGITGAILADRLTREGFDVLVLDGRDVGEGSTSASTALLQYEIDTPLTELIELVGREHAEQAYRLCLKSIDQLADLARGIDDDCGFDHKQSIFVASNPDDVPALRDEAAARRACGIAVEFVEQPELARRFPLSNPAALVSEAGASCDPYRLAHGLLQRALRGGARVCDRTAAVKVAADNAGVTITTDRGGTVSAKHVVFATGYESQSYLKERVTKLISTYAMVTQPLASVAPWNPDWLLWESARPYLYLRVTSDGRILAGGEDDNFRSPSRRDARVWKKGQTILERVRELLPELSLEVEFAWAGTFGETKDGLAYIGESPEMPHATFALGFGGNGITFSMVAADIIADQLKGRPNSDADIFRFGR